MVDWSFFPERWLESIKTDDETNWGCTICRGICSTYSIYYECKEGLMILTACMMWKTYLYCCVYVYNKPANTSSLDVIIDKLVQEPEIY